MQALLHAPVDDPPQWPPVLPGCFQGAQPPATAGATGAFQPASWVSSETISVAMGPWLSMRHGSADRLVTMIGTY